MANNFWRDRSVLVTGATGLLGGWLIRRLLSRGADVVFVMRDWVPQSELVRTKQLDEVKVVCGDVTDRRVIERTLGEYEVQTVLHLAAQALVGVANTNPISTFESNIQGTWTVLEACRHAPHVESIVIASSDKAYGAQTELPYHEGMPLEGRHPYDVSKSCADLIAQTYAATYNLRVGITRCGNFYGGGDLNWNRVVPGTIRSVLRGERLIIRSDGEYIRDYLYVEDGAAAYMLLAEQLVSRPELAGMAFNFSNEIQLTVRQLVQKILDKMGSHLAPKVQNRPLKEIRWQYLKAQRARELLNWAPEFTLDQGLERTIAWYRNLLEEYPSGVEEAVNTL
jgi:CDP-glucose 4,6-dehydratase